MKVDLYFEEKDLKHLIKRLEPLITQKINWCGTGTIVSKEDKILERLVSNMKYMIENPDQFKNKPKTFECACMNDIVCCECGEELFEDEYASSPEPFADEMHDYYILHRRCDKCEQEKKLQARKFVENIDGPYFHHINLKIESKQKHCKTCKHCDLKRTKEKAIFCKKINDFVPSEFNSYDCFAYEERIKKLLKNTKKEVKNKL